MKIFETIVGKQHRITATKAVEFFQEQMIMDSGRIVPVNDVVYKIAPDVDSLPQWNHPVTLNSKDKVYSFVDTRSFESPDGRIRNGRELPLLFERGTLAALWEEDRGHFQPMMSTLSAIYAEWLISAIRGRYGPTERELETIRIYLITHYMTTAFTDEEWKDLTENDISERIFRVLSRELRRPTNFLDEVMGNDPYQDFLKSLVVNRRPNLQFALESLTDELDNVAIRLDTQALIMLVIRSSWMGFAAQDIVGVAIEYPPYLVHMVNQALLVGVYRRTKIGAAVESAKRQRIDVMKIANWVKEVMSEVE